MKLTLLADAYSVCRLDAGAGIPDWATATPFFSVSRSAHELSIVCRQDLVPPAVRAEHGWRCFEVAGPLDFALTGVVASLSTAIANAGLSIFVVSTFDTDYLLVKEKDTAAAARALSSAGHEVHGL